MIKQYRLSKKLSQEELAEEVGISWRQLQRLEHNEENTRVSTFKKIVKADTTRNIEFYKKINQNIFGLFFCLFLFYFVFILFHLYCLLLLYILSN